METFGGAKIPTLKKAWERSYISNPLPIDTMLVAGLNDIIELVHAPSHEGVLQDEVEAIAEDFMHRVRALHRLVLEHSTRFKNDTFAVGTIVHVPALYWHPDDGSFPSPDYTNYKELIDRINLKIQEFNILIGSIRAPKFHELGERGKGSKRKYMYEAFREENPANMMHLKDKHRRRMVKLIMKYVEMSTPQALQIN